MLRLFAWIAVLALIYHSLKDNNQGSRMYDRQEPPPKPVVTEDLQAWQWESSYPIPVSQMQNYTRFSSTQIYHNDSIPPGMSKPKWIRPPKVDRNKFVRTWLTEDEIRDIVNEELD